MLRAILLLLTVASARAEFLEISVFMRDMSCESCTETLANAFKRMRGVESVEVDFKAGTVALKLSAASRVGPEQVWDAIKRVGFTPGATQVRVAGSVKQGKLEVPETGKTYEVEGVSDGENIQLKGSTAPPPDPRTPIRITSIQGKPVQK